MKDNGGQRTINKFELEDGGNGNTHFNPCDTPANPVQSECKEVAPAIENLKIKMHAGPEGLAIEFSVPVKMVIFNKQEALKLGELIIENALKL